MKTLRQNTASHVPGRDGRRVGQQVGSPQLHPLAQAIVEAPAGLDSGEPPVAASPVRAP